MAELLAPAGNVEALDAAFGEGADAVYLGLKSFNARLRSTNFAWNQFEAAVQSAHRQGKKIYVTVNTVCEESETERLYRFLSYLNRIGPDGLIVQDFGVVRMCQEFFPNLPIHASTQMNIASAEAATVLARQGIKRVVLARELGLEEIKQIKANTTIQLEVFVHGALCISESGLCLFSSFLGGKSANRGMCTQACRRFYTAEQRNGTEQGFYFSPCDLQLLEHIPELMTLGIDSFKIEGRMKSAEYVGAVTAAYRFVMDHWQEDRKGVIAEGKRILSTDFARSKTDYWYGFALETDGIAQAGEKILNPNQAGGTGIYLGKISDTRGATAAERNSATPQTAQQPSETAAASDKTAKVRSASAAIEIQMARILGGSYDPDPGDSIRLHKKDDTGRQSHKVRTLTIDDKNRRWIDVPLGFHRGDDVYLLQTKSMSKRYKHVLPQDLSKFYHQPGGEHLPMLDLTPLKKNELDWFPEGLYVGVSTISDAYMVQPLHPIRVILELNNESEYDLLNKDTPEKPVLPFSKKTVIISLDPFVAQASIEHLRIVLDTLVQNGFKTFIVNNLAHIVLLRNKDVHLIAGPYLYTFNSWAVSFLENQNIMAIQTPIENSESNLEATFKTPEEHSRVLLSVFAYPQLFRIRFQLPKSYDFTYFSDKEQTGFKVNSTPDGSFVMPEIPFSLIDRMDSLKAKGWKRLLIDFSKTKVRKSDAHDILLLLQSNKGVAGSSRFNWKDGFYNPEKMEAYQAIAAKEALEKKSRFKSGKKKLSAVKKLQSSASDKKRGSANKKYRTQKSSSRHRH